MASTDNDIASSKSASGTSKSNCKSGFKSPPPHVGSPVISDASMKRIFESTKAKQVALTMDVHTFCTRMMEIGYGPFMKNVAVMNEEPLLELLLVFEEAVGRYNQGKGVGKPPRSKKHVRGDLFSSPQSSGRQEKKAKTYHGSPLNPISIDEE